jgi:hypothetical protein
MDGVATQVTRFDELCMRQDYVDADGIEIRRGHRVQHPQRGAGTVVTVIGSSVLLQHRVYVAFDSGTQMSVPPRDLVHI